MAVEDEPLFNEWEKAYRRLEARQAFYAAAKDRVPETHPLVQSANDKRDEARAEYEGILRKL